MAAEATRTPAEATMKAMTNPLLTSPRGRARAAVRGFLRSKSTSTSRLNAMAALRAPTMASVIQAAWAAVGAPRAAMNAPRNANGRAKSVCSILIISSTIPTFRYTPAPCLRKLIGILPPIHDRFDRRIPGADCALQPPGPFASLGPCAPPRIRFGSGARAALSPAGRLRRRRTVPGGDGIVRELELGCEADVTLLGDRIVIEAPGGGGWGRPK